MSLLFKLLGALLAAYVLAALTQGTVVAKRGLWSERIDRSTAPRRFWTVIAIYAALAVALVTVF